MTEANDPGFEVRILYVWCKSCSGHKKDCVNCLATGVNPCPWTEIK
jgi:hypothetical protein